MRASGACQRNPGRLRIPTFYTALGWFYAIWSRTELAIDCAMWKASGTETAEEAHERSARMKFSDKCKRFRILLDGGKIPNGEKVKDLLSRIEDHSMRNVFAHSFLASDEHSVRCRTPIASGICAAAR
jgi:hypothetical protein